ncbi:MAG: NAD(P)/FAD-dependent oxidoreductase [Microcoleus sp. PH2017_10_PVI_O_A]|uniref:NAD(P)/FAD-dependent oxidoreductase n=1 Tax=unclassified Microcoleus TaxID=2642155 RepID=UPI001DE5AD3C|nr:MULTISPECIES: NAD(P)/FAD-dependent oxidoreductase [unclassified Microcoleus]TAE80934.1 MAG: NAD(P)/FAD-dependent oxidoreductase [Oscillatoriales cyanobacterium]MCC3407357.1 NAD(P)/FAD-dependent oxidoreductase [Microcoleus sp. PH2017_10_PVI_O_A]MCC3461407.1 NAD(P)/FAD-dependent oxidoreductase [Microcoleus sp. PH2017_11_PCY_U_A]MCC3479882.1 NAD(P)/FAD-dependent oxidoreductase [Microcoleus sp. PH2017_12_PCY_D_A]MCC3530552.1 NAD(P)/FAD-dependent oxidoreductase [Microcoleus sp. PH2017_21_RUC_O_A
MLRITEIKLPLDHPEDAIASALLKKLQIPPAELLSYTIFKRSYDARKKAEIVLVYIVDVETTQEKQLLQRFKKDPHVMVTPDTSYRNVAQASSNLTVRPIVIGTGPCGMFAGLMLAQMGFRPILLERGKAVRDRTADTFGFWKKKAEFNPESNAQFGEGGAGTFSDGKLYSQVKDPQHYGRKVLTELVKAGASPEILYINKPHIGTLKLVGIVQNMRARIESLGGEIRFQTRVEDIHIENGKVQGITTASGEYIASNYIVLAVGHSARDTFEMLFSRGVYIEAKPFSIGFRVEHPQKLIDRCRFGDRAGHKLLGAADYKLVHHCQNNRSVYSFCMCPGGLVVAAASEPGRVVTNGMSQYSRNERNANSGIVVGITPEDYPGHPLAGIEFQRRLEERAFELGGSTYNAPGQLVGDFLANRPSTALGAVQPSYTPGVVMTDLSESLPDFAIAAIREALPAFDKQIKGFAMDDAVLTGVETRTSSPIRIERKEDYQSLNTEGLYPAGEGAGYAGGILSAGIDGIKVAEAVALSILRSSNHKV